MLFHYAATFRIFICNLYFYLELANPILSIIASFRISSSSYLLCVLLLAHKFLANVFFQILYQNDQTVQGQVVAGQIEVLFYIQ